MAAFYNTHIHTFRGDKDVPENYLPIGLVKLLSTKVGFFIVANLMSWLNSFSKNGMFERYRLFAALGKLGSQQAIFEKCYNEYPKDTKFIVLTMDMAYMGAGAVPRKYEDQLIELSNLQKIYPDNVLPFIHIDCRRDNCFDLFKTAIEQWNFKGLKLYPTLGTFPFDKRYYPIYEYCQTHNLPVVAHCSDGNPVFYKGKKNDLLQLLQGSTIPLVLGKKDNKALCAYFTHPLNYQQVMDDFPNLKICLAHYGKGNDAPNDVGGMNWDQTIKEMMKTYPNLYVDCAYSLYNQNWWSSIKVQLSTDPLLRDHFMFGSDFYMLEVDGTEKQCDIDFRAFIGEELFQQIAVTNPKKFMNVS